MTLIESVKTTAPLPAVQGQFGPRLATYTTQLPAAAIETILGHDPRSKLWKKLPDDLEYLYNHLQRATTKARLDSLIRYVKYRFTDRAIIAGAFPAISIAVQNPTEFESLEHGPSGVGILHFDLSRRNRRVVVDGLGRVSAILELLDWSESADLFDDEKKSLQNLLNSFTLPAVFYVPAPGTEPLKLEEMQQLFHDFNFKVSPVPARIAIALDHSDPYIALTNRLGESDLIKRFGGMERKAASLGKKSTALVVQQNLLRFVRGAAEGEKFLEAKNTSEIENPNLTEDTLDDHKVALLNFIENVSLGMGEDQFTDRECLHLTSPGWGTLGILYHDLAVTLDESDVEGEARKIGMLKWHRSAPEWQQIVRQRTDKEGNMVLGLAAGGAQTRRFMTAKVRKALGIESRLLANALTPKAA